jgi:hypothetical protein
LVRQVGAFRVLINIVFQMEIITNIDDVAGRMQLGEKITFGSLDFIADQFGDLHLQVPELPVE